MLPDRLPFHPCNEADGKAERPLCILPRIALVVSDAAPGAREAYRKTDLPGQGTADMLVGYDEVVIGHDVEVGEVYRYGSRVVGSRYGGVDGLAKDVHEASHFVPAVDVEPEDQVVVRTAQDVYPDFFQPGPFFDFDYRTEFYAGQVILMHRLHQRRPEIVAQPFEPGFHRYDGHFLDDLGYGGEEGVERAVLRDVPQTDGACVVTDTVEAERMVGGDGTCVDRIDAVPVGDRTAARAVEPDVRVADRLSGRAVGDGTVYGLSGNRAPCLRQQEGKAEKRCEFHPCVVCRAECPSESYDPNRLN